MASKTTTAVKITDLSAREGKVLRYFVSKHVEGEAETPTDNCIVLIQWSDLPHNHYQAVQATAKLKAKGLLEAGTKGHVKATKAGIKLMARADAAGKWRKPPPASVTNNNTRYI